MKKKFATWIVAVFMVVSTMAAQPIQNRLNGFDVSNACVPVSEIFSGGPPRDGIPAIDAPKFIRPDAARFMQDRVNNVPVEITCDPATRLAVI